MVTAIHQEVVFEDEICSHLKANGWLFDGPLPYEKGHAYDAGYDKRHALFPDDSIAWVKKTQPDVWAKFTSHHGDAQEAEREFIRMLAADLDRERKTIRKDDPQLWGSLHTLRRGFKHINATFKMAQFAPANSLNPKLWDDFGMQGSQLYGYWSPNVQVRTGREDVKATVFKQDGRALVAIASWAADTVSITPQVDWAALGIDPARATITAPAVGALQDARTIGAGERITLAPGKGILLVIR